MREALLTLAASRRAGRPTGITAICSAHPLVLEAALRHAVMRDAPVLIEATCNQVNHEGGYTGMTPAEFRVRLDALAATCGLPAGRLLLGGDHLGPNPWTSLPAEAALQRAEAMVAAFVAAGFTKLHLDTSMRCADDPLVLAETTVAARAARLAAVAEATARLQGLALPAYVIGTEVPPPGGAPETIDRLTPSEPGAAEATIASHAEAFAAAGVAAAMQRVVALVVQPGVEFGTDNVVTYDAAAARPLTLLLDRHPHLVFEAHSTDYQPSSALAALVQDGFAIRKVGPWLTFALRETLYSLDALAAALDGSAPQLPAVMERLMLAMPQHWSGHYHGPAPQQRLMRHYSYSDRIRYYWPMPDAEAAVARLLARLAGAPLPTTLISQYLPSLRERVASGLLPARPHDLLLAAVTDVLAQYDGTPERASRPVPGSPG